MAAGSSTNESRSETRRQAALNDKNKKSVEEFSCKCQRTFTTSSGYKRHQRFCPENETNASTCKTKNNEESKVEEPSSEKNYEEEAEDSSQRESNDEGMSDDSNNGTLTEEMLESMGDLMDQALDPGKCHCCGEDLDTAHEGGDFECADCQKRFKLKSSLERHRRVIHMEGETFQCPECDARCPDKGTLARHMYTHTGLKPYSCLRCRKTFSRKYHLERHVLQTGCDGSPKPNHPCQESRGSWNTEICEDLLIFHEVIGGENESEKEEDNASQKSQEQFLWPEILKERKDSDHNYAKELFSCMQTLRDTVMRRE